MRLPLTRCHCFLGLKCSQSRISSMTLICSWTKPRNLEAHKRFKNPLKSSKHVKLFSQGYSETGLGEFQFSYFAVANPWCTKPCSCDDYSNKTNISFQHNSKYWLFAWKLKFFFREMEKWTWFYRTYSYLKFQGNHLGMHRPQFKFTKSRIKLELSKRHSKHPIEFCLRCFLS